MLCHYSLDPSHVISPTEIEIQPYMTYNVEPIRILARKVKELINKRIALVKVLWQRHGVEEATWEPQEAMRKQYPNLFTARCLLYQEVRTEHQVPSGLLQPVMIPEWKWDKVWMDFLSGLPLSSKKKDVVWVVVDRLAKSAHFILVRTNYLLDRLAELYMAKIIRLHGLQFQLFWIEIRVLPSELEKIHNVFYVSMLRRYRSDPSHVISPSEIEIQPYMTYNEEPVRILAREIKELTNKCIALVKVLWQRHGVEEAMLEPEEAMRK
ncbi:integrase [Gossypium australe]|uniref:Integrase n=1 Tax=Gossypium australe TaxID=47621 RepID=A0A5B6VL42_9ROSI|nr:integrase [Gossypium australe]